MKTIVITGTTIELYKMLKFEALVASGGEAKALIDVGEVRVNGEVETRKRKKLSAGDTIHVFGEDYVIAATSVADNV